MKHLLTRKLRLFATVVAILGVAMGAAALDLPTKEVNGKQYYYYKVQKGETVYSLSHRFGVTYDDMIKYNPWISEGLKHGKTLYFPIDEFADTKSRNNTVEHKVKRGETLYSVANKYSIPIDDIIRLNPDADEGLKAGQILVIPTEENVGPVESQMTNELPHVKPELESHAADVVYDETEPGSSREFAVAVAMPFALDNPKPGKPAVYATDFYRGFLLAIDSLRSEYNNPRINVTAIDVSDVPSLKRNEGTLRMMDMIIAPDNADVLNELNKFGIQNQIYVLNNFQARDTAPMTNPYAIQGNILQADMFDRAIDYFIDYLNGATPVVLDNTKGTKDKEPFVKQLMSRLANEGIEVKTLSFSGELTSNAVSELLPIEGNDYVFIPMSGSLTEFNKFAHALKNYQKESSEYARPGSIRLFGYPEYTRFSNDALDDLSRLNTTFYSRFYNDSSLGGNDRLNASFIKWFGTELPDGVPNQALYGFDTARWLLALASRGELDESRITGTRITMPAQQAYIMRHVPDGGYINDALFFVTITPGQAVKVELK